MATITKSEYKFMRNLLNNTVRGKLIFTAACAQVEVAAKEGTVFMVCPLNDIETRKCTIYEKRPRVCRKFHCSPKLNGYIKPVSGVEEHVIADLFMDKYKQYYAENAGVIKWLIGD
jgi:Fe-S-cluster containining protein